MKPFWVYILRCADGSYYTGHTDDLERRIGEHQTGTCDGYTRDRRPVKLAWSQECVTREEALAAEIQIKGWSRKKKEAMMRGDWQEVNKLGRGKHRHERKALHASTLETASPTLSTNGDSEIIDEAHPPVRPERSAAKSKGNIRAAQTQAHFYLGLDFGTSGARACAIDHQKSIVWEQRVAFPSEQTPLDWRTALHTLLGALPDGIAAQLQGLAIDGTSGTVLLCDAELKPVSPALLYHDNRAQQQAEQLKAIANNGNIVCTATSGIAKFLWLTQQTDSHHAAYFLHQADWLTALLSGKPGISDYHNALKTGYDVGQLCWPDWLMALPHAHLLPQVLAPGEIIGQIQPDIAAHFGIHPQCVIHAGTTDSIAAFIASSATGIGTGVTSLGTTLVLKQLSAIRIDAPEYGVYSHSYGDLWLVGGASNAGAGVLRQYFDDAQLAALSKQIDPLQDSPLDYYPLIKPGERFPVNDAQLAPRLEPRPANDVEFLHGLLQSLARIEAAGYDRLAELGAPPLRRVATNGGGAQNTAWEKLRERLLGVPVSAAVHAEAAYGSALLCTGEHYPPRNIASNCPIGTGLPNKYP